MTSPSAPSMPVEPVNLRAMRRRMGLTREAAAREIGVSIAVLMRAERGVQPVVGNAARICAFYGLDPVVQWPERAAA